MSKFHTAKEKFVCLFFSGPGLVSIVPERKRRIGNTKRKKRILFTPDLSDLQQWNEAGDIV